MKVIIFSQAGVKEIIEHFVSYGYDDFIVFEAEESDFKNTDRRYYELNDIKITSVQTFSGESTYDSLCKIRGSIFSRFFLVYSPTACDTDLDSVILFHNSHQGIATLIEEENNRAISSAIFEEELLDYFKMGGSLERDVLKRIGQDCELEIYKA